MSLAQAILAELKKCGVNWITWLPDSETGTTYKLMKSDPEICTVGVCHEAEAVGVCYGLLKGGARAAVMIQNTGLMNAVDAIRGIPIRMQQPMLLLVGYRGYRGLIEKAPKVDNAATFTEPLLQALKIPYYMVHTEGEAGVVSQAYAEAQRTLGPVVVLMTKENE